LPSNTSFERAGALLFLASLAQLAARRSTRFPLAGSVNEMNRLTGTLVLGLLGAACSSAPPCPHAAPAAQFSLETGGGNWNHSRVLVDGSGNVTLETFEMDRLYRTGNGKQIYQYCLSREQLHQLVDLLESSRFFDFPEDLSSPPYYVDEPMKYMKVELRGVSHFVTAGGLERAAEPTAVAYRELWNAVQELVASPRAKSKR
jgi:hypothetical protein